LAARVDKKGEGSKMKKPIDKKKKSQIQAATMQLA